MTSAVDAIKYFLRKTFDLREGEIVRATLMQLNIFLIITTLLMVKPSVSSLFNQSYGAASLPYAFVLVAISWGIISTFYSRALARIQLNKIIVTSLYGSVAILILLGFLLIFNLLTGWVLYFAYVWVAIFALLSTSQFWILANVVFNSREAKRLFGFIGAGAIAGGIVGGYLTSILTTFMSTESLLFVCAFLLSLCIPITKYIWKNNVAPSQQHVQQKKRMGGDGRHPFLLILKSRHLSYMAIIIGVGVLVAKLVEYQFNSFAAENFPNTEDQAAFFGFWLSTLSIISLLVQLFITPKVVGVFGVGTSLFFLPGGIFIGALLLFFFPFLWAAILVRIFDGSLKQSINKSAIELLALPIPVEIKSRTKSFIDIFVDSFATGVGGLILIFLVDGLEMSVRAITLMILALIGVWIYFAIIIRKEYIQSFKQRIGGRAKAKKEEEPSKDSVYAGLMNVLESGSDQQILFVLNKARELEDNRLFEHIRSLLHHPNPEVRAEALRSLYFYKNDPVIEEVEQLINDESQQVKIGAFEYLLQHGSEDRLQRMERYLRDPDFRVSGAALVSLGSETRDNPGMMQRFQFEARLNDRLELISKENDPAHHRIMLIDLLKAIGQSAAKRFFFVIETALYDDDPILVKTAIKAAGNTLHLSFLPPILELLVNEKYVNEARAALVNYGHGVIEPMSELLRQPGSKTEILRVVPSVLEQIDSQIAVNFILDLLDREDVTVHLESLRSLNAMKMNFPHLRFQKKAIMNRILEETQLYRDTLTVLYAQTKIHSNVIKNQLSPAELAQENARESLVKLLEARMDSSLERIFRLLGLKYPTEDIIPIYEGLQSNKPDLRANAVEFLENLLESSLKKILIPVLETALLDGISEEAIKNLKINVPDEFTCYQTLLVGKDKQLKLAVLYLIGQLKDPKFMPLAQRYGDTDNQRIRSFVDSNIGNISTEETPI